MKALKKTVIGLLVFFAVASAVLLAMGKFYYWKALAYNYVNIDDLDLFPVRTVKAGVAEPWNISSAYNKIPLTDKLKNELEKFKTVSFLVVKNDSIVNENYWDSYSDSSLSNSFSMAKSVISILIGIAVDDGRIKNIDEPVGNYLPAFKNSPNDVLTIRHLLTMSSGLNWNESYSSLTSQTTEAYYGTKLFKQMKNLKVVAPPGKNFDYMSCNTQLLAFVLKKATGKTISEYATEKLWKPVHAEHDAEWSLDHKEGNEKAYCCIYSNVRDFARIGKLYLDSGRWNGKQIVSENYVLQSVTPAPLLDEGRPNRIYGYQWWIDNSASGQNYFYCRGLLGQYIIVIPAKKIIIVRLGMDRDKTPEGKVLDYPLFVEEVLKMYS